MNHQTDLVKLRRTSGTLKNGNWLRTDTVGDSRVSNEAFGGCRTLQYIRQLTFAWSIWTVKAFRKTTQLSWNERRSLRRHYPDTVLFCSCCSGYDSLSEVSDTHDCNTDFHDPNDKWVRLRVFCSHRLSSKHPWSIVFSSEHPVTNQQSAGWINQERRPDTSSLA